MTQSSVNLTAEEEQACGAAIQELLTIEAMATQLAEESIAAELRDEKGVGDPFAVAHAPLRPSVRGFGLGFGG